MKNILVIHSSPNLQSSQTRELTSKVVAQIRRAHPNATFVHRDLIKTELPHIKGEDLEAIFAKDTNPEHPFNRRSLVLINELKAADLVVIALPMYNFSVPSNVKAWIDHIARPGLTFSYTAEGPVGLLKGRKAILVTSAAGVYSAGPTKDWDYSEPFMKRLLTVMGIDDVQVVRVEGLAIPQLKDNAMKNAEQ